MKSFGLFVSLALALSVSAAPQNNRQGGNRGGNNNNGQNQNGQNQNGQNQNGQNNGGNNGGDPQKSLTLDPKVIAAGFAKNGQEVPAAGQVASLTSTNNYINFCLTSPNTPITDGKQVQGGSCNPTPMGLIPSIDRQPSSKFVSPKNLDNIAANTPFTVQMVVSNLKTGNFVNAQSNYYSAPQQLDGSGTIIGHTHITIEALTSLQQTTATEPKKFAFFKGVNGAADGQGIVTVEVDKGLPAGAYRCCSINTNANHGPVVGPVAQRGSFDDCVYWTVGGNGQQNNGQNNGQQNNGQQNNGQQNNGQQNNGQQNGQQNNGQQNNGQQNNGQQNNGQQNNGQQQQNGQQGQNNGQQNNGRFGRGRFGGRRNRSL